MITPETIGDAPEALLPKDKQHDWPLLVVMAIMAFLAGLALLLSAMSIRATNNWQDDLKQTATVQVFVNDDEDRDQVLLSALEILDAQTDDLNAKAVPDETSRDMLRPWLGDLILPDDLPLPILIALETSAGQKVDANKIKLALAANNITANVDDHSRWAARISRATRTAQVSSLFILILVFAASVATSGFATQSALEARRSVIKVLTQVGAKDNFIARLFVNKFFTLGIKAGAIGSFGALIFAILIRLLVGGQRESALFPNMSLSGGDIFLLILLPGFFGVISAGAAGWTSLQILKRDRKAL